MRRSAWLIACLSLFVCKACTLCANPHDCKYAGYGGVRERVDLVHGRVGSVFDPALEISHVAASRQSPQEPVLADPIDRDGADPELSTPDQSMPDPSTPAQPTPDVAPPTRRPEPPAAEVPLPENGSIELPDFDDDVDTPSLPDTTNDSFDDLLGI